MPPLTPSPPITERLAVFMFTDVADSTRLKQRSVLGGSAYAQHVASGILLTMRMSVASGP